MSRAILTQFVLRGERVPLCVCAFFCTTCHQIQKVPLVIVTNTYATSESYQETKATVVLGMGRQK